MPCSPVSIATDIALPLIPLVMTFHDLVPVPPVPPVPPPGIYPCIEIPVMMMWPPGYALQQNKLTTTVLHKFLPMALDGHDCGYMIPHIKCFGRGRGPDCGRRRNAHLDIHDHPQRRR